MIVDTLANRHIYQSLSPRIATALAHLASADFSQLPVGNYHLDGEDIFVIVNDYHTKPQSTEPFEVHQKYIDVQYVVSGEEEFGYLPLADQTPSKPYFEKHDYAEFDYESNKANASYIQLKAGMFALFFPGDMHMPGTSDTPTAVRKVVIKVKI
ncbi:YhcH/YjgK/YiaL family protein [Shewanella xiamenensis]|uniref:YhcH/YjgK/YiaL family protein n=1 Tax=Shewanella xiamenensis TaxID=332186 RepID=UPI001F0559C5|nr:YhcH/YjgK/YiaL family protein [Shewanella xiamenensis]UML94251.1 YhcH/YjgK/YiaL family protein [Shewanella xiamenensis]